MRQSHLIVKNKVPLHFCSENYSLLKTPLPGKRKRLFGVFNIHILKYILKYIYLIHILKIWSLHKSHKRMKATIKI